MIAEAGDQAERDEDCDVDAACSGMRQARGRHQLSTLRIVRAGRVAPGTKTSALVTRARGHEPGDGRSTAQSLPAES
jgi:hypothetical protein